MLEKNKELLEEARDFLVGAMRAMPDWPWQSRIAYSKMYEAMEYIKELLKEG